MQVREAESFIKSEILKMASEEGYFLSGIAAPEIALSDQLNIQEFSKSLGDEMSWYSKFLELRKHPENIFVGSKSALVLAVSYRDIAYENSLAKSRLKISRYAAGRDYHRVLAKKGKNLLKKIQMRFPEIRGRITVDSAPVPEKILAANAGLGWQGKHTNLIHKTHGSYFFLSVIFLNTWLSPDEKTKDLCGTCRICIDSCPTGALIEYKIDAAKCISYLTIEKKTPIPDALTSGLSGWIFGCDICQEVCPYNKRERSCVDTAEDKLIPLGKMRDLLEKINDRGRDIKSFSFLNSEEEYKEYFEGSPLRRITKDKFQDNFRNATN